MWTFERVTMLRKMHAEGASATQTAKALGGFAHCADGGRSAICGKWHRLGLKRMNGGAGEAVRRMKIERARRRAIVQRKAAITFIPNKVLKPTKTELLRTELALIAALPPTEPGLSIQAIRDNQCRYMNGDPQSDGTLCGRLTASGSWCAQHRKLVYQPSKPKAIVRTVEGDEKRRQLRELTRREQFQMGVAV